MFKCSKRNQYILALYLFIGLARVSQSFGKLPADPGFERLREVRMNGFWGIFSQSLGYLDISARVGPWVATLVGLRFSASILTFTTVLFTSLLALIIFFAVNVEIGSLLIAIISGALLMLVPAAAESTLGNHGSLKWPLIVALCVVISAPKFYNRYKGIALALIFLTGLSNPFAFVAIPGAASHLLGKKDPSCAQNG